MMTDIKVYNFMGLRKVAAIFSALLLIGPIQGSRRRATAMMLWQAVAEHYKVGRTPLCMPLSPFDRRCPL